MVGVEGGVLRLLGLPKAIAIAWTRDHRVLVVVDWTPWEWEGVNCCGGNVVDELAEVRRCVAVAELCQCCRCGWWSRVMKLKILKI